MKLTEEDFKRIVKWNTIEPGSKGYIILLGGRQFISHNGKRVFASKSSAKLSLKANLKYFIRNLVYQHLVGRGLDHYDIIRSEDYMNSWKNFEKQATESGFLQIVEIK